MNWDLLSNNHPQHPTGEEKARAVAFAPSPF
jgi:hypothetical protein